MMKVNKTVRGIIDECLWKETCTLEEYENYVKEIDAIYKSKVLSIERLTKFLYNWNKKSDWDLMPEGFIKDLAEAIELISRRGDE